MNSLLQSLTFGICPFGMYSPNVEDWLKSSFNSRRPVVWGLDVQGPDTKMDPVILDGYQVLTLNEHLILAAYDLH